MIPNKQSYILGTIYNHPSMKHFKVNNEYMEELLRVITHENKNYFSNIQNYQVEVNF